MTKATWLDRTIGWISPARGAARIRSRMLSDALLAYDAATQGRRTNGWGTASTSADVEIGVAHQTTRDRARDLVRNNPYAAKGVGAIVSNKIGTGIICQPLGPNRRTNKRLDERYREWVQYCDATGTTDYYGLQALAERTRCESGEVLVLLIKTAPKFDGDVPLRLKVLEPDFIDSSRNEVIDERREIRYGIEYFDQVPVAYWLFDQHPGDGSSTMSLRSLRGYQSRPHPASEVIHYYKPLRAGQSRGITDLASVILRLRAIDDYDDAEVLRKKIAACLAAFITTPTSQVAESIFPSTLDDAGRKITQFNPGMVVNTPPGSSVTVADPKPSTDYRDFNTVQLHAVSAGMQVPYELLTNDLVEVNYSSIRIGLTQFIAALEADRWHWTIPQLCRPICHAFTAAAAIREYEARSDIAWRYTPPRIDLLDPSKEVPPLVEAMKAGLDSGPNTLQREGYDWLEKLDEIAEWNKELDARGIVLSSDPRQEMKLKQAQAAKPPPPAGGVNADAA